MNNTEKKLDALIDALGFDVERLTTNRNAVEEYKKRKTDIINLGLVGDVPIGNRPKPEYDYKITKRDINSEPLNCHVDCVPLPVQSDAWGAIVHYCINHEDDIEAGVDDFDTLRPIWEFMKGKNNE
tara:strand:- start:37 stop:414 length:378 start_codon:yes stop_codon:yes gene_type:complete